MGEGPDVVSETVVITADQAELLSDMSLLMWIMRVSGARMVVRCGGVGAPTIENCMMIRGGRGNVDDALERIERIISFGGLPPEGQGVWWSAYGPQPQALIDSLRASGSLVGDSDQSDGFEHGDISDVRD